MHFYVYDNYNHYDNSRGLLQRGCLTLPRLRALTIRVDAASPNFAGALQFIGLGLQQLSSVFAASVVERAKTQCDWRRLRRLSFNY